MGPRPAAAADRPEPRKIVTMRWADVSPDGMWTIRTAPREKGNPGSLSSRAGAGHHPLEAALCQQSLCLRRQWRRRQQFARRKEALDAASGVANWTIHDLRRTARSLMSRAGVQPDIAERVLGHAVAGVEGIYDRHHYDDEKADALRRLAALIERIVNPPSDNVVALHEAAAHREQDQGAGRRHDRLQSRVEDQLRARDRGAPRLSPAFSICATKRCSREWPKTGEKHWKRQIAQASRTPRPTAEPHLVEVIIRRSATLRSLPRPRVQNPRRRSNPSWWEIEGRSPPAMGKSTGKGLSTDSFFAQSTWNGVISPAHIHDVVEAAPILAILKIEPRPTSAASAPKHPAPRP